MNSSMKLTPNNEPRYAFFGTPEFAATILTRLIASGLKPAIVITNPDRPAGRDKRLTPPPVKTVAEASGIEVIQPETPANEELGIKNYDIEFGVLAAYGKIVPKAVIEMFPKGIIVVHPSLLPKYRGATPIQSALLAGESSTGTTLFLMDELVDHGPVITKSDLRIMDNESRTELEKRLAELSAKLLIDTLPKFVEGKILPTPQNHAEATYTKKITTEDGRVDLKRDLPELIMRKIRALNPEPGVFTEVEGKRVKIIDANLKEGKLTVTKIHIAGKSPREITPAEAKTIFE